MIGLRELIDTCFDYTLSMAIDDGDDYGEHVGLQSYRRAVLAGRDEVLAAVREVLAAKENTAP